MLVRELMTRTVVTVVPDDDLASAVRAMARHRVTSLPVVNADGEVVGLIGEADVLRQVTLRDPRAHLRRAPEGTRPWPRRVGEVMTPGPWCSTEGADLADVARTMAERGWKSVPVVDDDRHLVGLLSRSDVVAVLTTDDDAIEEEVARELAEAGRGEWAVTVQDGVVTVHGVPEHEASLAQDVAATARGVRGVLIRSSGR